MEVSGAMSMRILRSSILIISLFIPAVCAGGAAHDVFVRVTSSSITPFGPEVHVRLINTTISPERFTIGFDTVDGTSAYCQRGIDVYRDATPERYRRGSRRVYRSHVGLIQPGHWVHEVLPLDVYRGHVPCRVMVRIQFGGETIEQTVSVDAAEYYPVIGEDRIEGVLYSSEVSQVSEAGEYSVKTLVENTSDRPVYVFVIDRQLDCPRTRVARWSTYNNYMQGLDTGPITLSPKSWIVFSNLIRGTDDRQLIGECKGSIAIGSLNSDYQPYSIGKSKFSLSDISAEYSPLVPTK